MLNQYRGLKRLEVFLAAVVLMASVLQEGLQGVPWPRQAGEERGQPQGPHRMHLPDHPEAEKRKKMMKRKKYRALR